MAQDLDQQPAAVAARARGEAERLFRRLHARLHAHDIGGLLMQVLVQPDQEIDRGALFARDRIEVFLQQRPGRFGADIGRNVLGERLRISKGEGLGVFLDEEVERIIDRHFGDQIDCDRKHVGRLGKDQPRQIIAVRVLLPVDEMVVRLDLQRISRDRRPAMRRRTQPDDLRPERNRTVVGIAGGMVKLGENGHGGESLFGMAAVPFMKASAHACHVFKAAFSPCGKARRPGNGRLIRRSAARIRKGRG